MNTDTSEQPILPGGVTPEQAEALRVIGQLTLEAGLSPSQQEICDRLGTTKTSAYQFVHRLMQKGCIRRAKGSCRNLVITDLGRQVIAAHRKEQHGGSVRVAEMTHSAGQDLLRMRNKQTRSGGAKP